MRRVNDGIAAIVTVMLALLIAPVVAAESVSPTSAQPFLAASMGRLEAELVGKYGEAQRARIRNGLKQTSDFWQARDGDTAVFEDFVRGNFAGETKTVDAIFNRYEVNLEQLDGHLHEINREFRNPADLDLAPGDCVLLYTDGASEAMNSISRRATLIERPWAWACRVGSR